MRYCQACGTAAPERAIYCPACGALLAAVPGSGPAPAPSAPPAASAPPPPDSPAPAPGILAPAALPPPAPGPRSAPSGRTLAIGLGGIGVLAVVVIGAWLLAGHRPGGAAPSATPAAATSEPSTAAATGAPTSGATPAPTPSPEPTEVPVPTDMPTAVPTPGIPSIVGDTPAEAIGAFLIQRGVDFAGICASIDPNNAPAGAYCADLFEEREAVEIWRAGPVASEPDTWLLVALTELGWSVADFAPIDDPTGGPPF